MRATGSWLRCIPCPVILAAGIVAYLVLSAWIWDIVTKTLSGSALEHCCLIGGAPFNYVGAFTLVVGGAVAMFVAGLLHLRDWWQWRTLRTRYGIVKAPGSETRSSSRWSGTRDTGDFDVD